MKRVLIIGSGGSGKSNLARQLGAKIGIEVIHLDSIYWRPGWIEPPKPEWKEKVAELLARESWVMDGNYSGTLELRVQSCDTIVFLDLPRLLCLWRTLKRRIQHPSRHRPDMAEGCPERLTFEFVAWIWNYRKRTRPKVLRLMQQFSSDKKVIHLRSRSEVKSFLEGYDLGIDQRSN
jgi:adenylate kinase family enzyme